MYLFRTTQCAGDLARVACRKHLQSYSTTQHCYSFKSVYAYLRANVVFMTVHGQMKARLSMINVLIIAIVITLVTICFIIYCMLHIMYWNEYYYWYCDFKLDVIYLKLKLLLLLLFLLYSQNYNHPKGCEHIADSQPKPRGEGPETEPTPRSFDLLCTQQKRKQTSCKLQRHHEEAVAQRWSIFQVDQYRCKNHIINHRTTATHTPRQNQFGAVIPAEL